MNTQTDAGNVVNLADYAATAAKPVNLIDYTRAIAQGRYPLEEKGGPRDLDPSTLAFLADIERVRDEGYSGNNQAFMVAFVTVMKNAEEEGDIVTDALEYWLRASIEELDTERERINARSSI
jgi:hypothetical protein